MAVQENDTRTSCSKSNIPLTSRRDFFKTTACLAIGSTFAGRHLAAAISEKGRVAIVAVPDDVVASSIPAAWAIGELKAALEKQAVTVRIVNRIADAGPDEFCVIAAGTKSPLVQRIASQMNLSVPTEAESLCLFQGKLEGREVLFAAGTDERGLVYALTELADRVNCLETGSAALEFAEPVIERPASRIRSVMRQFVSEVEDKPWFYDRDYWCSYLDMLVYSRLNRMSFTTGMAYNSAGGISDGYLLFSYPFFVDVPGSGVRVAGLSDEERRRNLEMLKFIAQETTRRGLRFQFGIWTLAYRWTSSPNATYTIEGLTDETHPGYCRDALALLLREVPAISGVTFRVHSESGIPKGSESFWKTQFSAIAECGRRCEIDMHAKNMEPETLDEALVTGQPVVISPKYCGEHLGLPYHQASIREREMVSPDKLTDTGKGVLIGSRGFTRYGYADTLAENRTWDVVFRIWPGTQRFLLNGDPATFAGYGRNAAFCGAAGIDLTEPLGFKGRRGTGHPGGRCAYIDASLNPRYDFEKYRYTYRLWGRLGYNPDADPEVWRRALRQEFGDAAGAVEKAIAPVSRVLTLFTLAHGRSADCARYWPEIYTNIPIADEERMRGVNHDMTPPNLFGNVSPLDPQLFMSCDECGIALVEKRASGKYTSLEAADWMESIAKTASENLDQARRKAGVAASKPAFRRMEEDVLIQSAMALFFAAKLRCSVLWRIYEMTGNRAAGEQAVARYEAGRDVWVKMAKRAQAVYHSDISYSSGGNIRGHWMDRIAEFDADIADLKKRLETPAQPKDKIDSAVAEQALKIALAKPVRPTISAQHTPAGEFRSGQPLSVALHCKAAMPKRVTLHYRHVNQAETWQSVELKLNGGDFAGEIPAQYTAKRYPLQYYFEVETGPAQATLVPLLADDLANVPYYVVRQADGFGII